MDCGMLWRRSLVVLRGQMMLSREVVSWGQLLVPQG